MGLKDYGGESSTPSVRFERALRELRSERSRKSYKMFLEAFLDFHGNSADELFEVVKGWMQSDDPAQVNNLKDAWTDFYNHLIDEGKSVNTASNYMKGVNKFLEANGLPRINAKKKHVEPKGVDHIDKEDVKRLVELASNERLRALVYTLDQSGLRCSDVVDLRVEDFLEAYKWRRTVNDKEFIRWMEPITSSKTGVSAHVCLGHEAIQAIKDYIKDRETGRIFLRERGMFRWETDEEGNRVKTGERTEAGSPMNSNNVVQTIYNLCSPFHEEGRRVSAHSFRKRFINNWRTFKVDGDYSGLQAGKYIAGKKIPDNDKAYFELETEYFDAYIQYYFENLDLYGTSREVQVLKEELRRTKAEYNRMMEELQPSSDAWKVLQRIRDEDPEIGVKVIAEQMKQSILNDARKLVLKDPEIRALFDKIPQDLEETRTIRKKKP